MAAFSVAQIADDYRVPVEFIMEMMLELGIAQPIRLTDTLGARLPHAQRRAEVVEEMANRLHGVCCDDVMDWYTDESVEEMAAERDVAWEDMLAACSECGVVLTMGAATRIRVEQRERVLARLGA